MKAELNASIKNLISRIKVRWQSGRRSSGELNIKDAIQAALQSSVMDVLLPDPLTFGFRLNLRAEHNSIEKLGEQGNSHECNGSINAHEMVPMEALVRNNTKETLGICLSVSCKDVAGENCIEGSSSTVLWEGVLTGIMLEVPPLHEMTHKFSLHFLVPGEYSLLAAAVIDDANDIIRARARTNSSDEPIFCRGPPFHVRAHGRV